MKRYIKPEMKIVNIKTKWNLLQLGSAKPPKVENAPKYNWEDEDFDESVQL